MFKHIVISSKFGLTSILLFASAFFLSACNDGGSSPNGTTAPVPLVQNLQAIAGDGQVVLSWDVLSGVDSYSVYWNTSGGVSDIDNVTIATTNRFTHTGLTNDTTYYYRVSATQAGQSGSLSSEVSATPATPIGITWTPQNSGVTDGLASVAWSGGLYVVVGSNGRILSSPDGITWTARVSGTSEHLYAVHWGDTLFIAAGNAGTILTSSDGINWSSQNSGTTGTIKDVEWNGSQYVAVGTTGTRGVVLTSPNGTTWTSRDPGTVYTLNDILWDGTQFMAVGTGSVVLTSPDGIVWTDRTFSTYGNLLFHQVVWSGSQYLAATYLDPSGGFVFTSTDGQTWSFSSSQYVGFHLTAADWNGTQFLVAHELGYVMSTMDPETGWTSQGTAGGSVLDILWADDHYLVVGANGMILTGGPAVACPAGTAWNSMYCI